MPETTNTEPGAKQPEIGAIEAAVITAIVHFGEKYFDQKSEKGARESEYYTNLLAEQTKMHEKVLVELGVLDTKDKWFKAWIALVCVGCLVLLACLNINDHGATAIISSLLTAVFVGSNNNLYTLFIKNQGGKGVGNGTEQAGL